MSTGGCGGDIQHSPVMELLRSADFETTVRDVVVQGVQLPKSKY